MPQTIGELRTQLMKEFGLSESNSNDATSSEMVLDYIATQHENFISHRNWTFNMGFYSLNLVADNSVDTAFTTAATSILLSDTSTWPLTGKINVSNNLIEFTANNLIKTLTVVTAGIQRNHEAGEDVSLLYSMPSDFGKPAEVRIQKQLYLPEDVRSEFLVSNNRFWQHHFVSDTGVYSVMLQFPHSTTTRTVYLKYSKLPVDLRAVDPSTYYVHVPNPHYEEFIRFSVMGRMYHHLEKHTTAQIYDNLSRESLSSASAYDSKQHSSNKAPIRTRWDNPAKVMYQRGVNIR